MLTLDFIFYEFFNIILIITQIRFVAYHHFFCFCSSNSNYNYSIRLSFSWSCILNFVSENSCFLTLLLYIYNYCLSCSSSELFTELFTSFVANSVKSDLFFSFCKFFLAFSSSSLNSAINLSFSSTFFEID